MCTRCAAADLSVVHFEVMCVVVLLVGVPRCGVLRHVVSNVTELFLGYLAPPLGWCVPIAERTKMHAGSECTRSLVWTACWPGPVGRGGWLRAQAKRTIVTRFSYLVRNYGLGGLAVIIGYCGN